jgi:hypothetical protein
MKLYGLMITKDDHEIFGDWCRDQLGLYDAVVCLDGSEGHRTKQIAQAFPKVIYLDEYNFDIPHKTDHGLRKVVHEQIVQRFGIDNWVMCCHADEFCYHDPRKVAEEATRQQCDVVAWHSLHFHPHAADLVDWPHRRTLPVTQRIRHYHWDYQGSGLPWREHRLYRNSPLVAWDKALHGSVCPHHVQRLSSLHPSLRHYKVFTTDLSWYEGREGKTLFRQHWVDQEHRTGLPFPVHKAEDLFVDALPGFGRCDRFDGTFRHPWNIGDQYCPDCEESLRPLC